MLDLRPIGDKSVPGAKWLVAAAQGKRSISVQIVNNLREALQVVSFSLANDEADWCDGQQPYDGQVVPPDGNNSIWVGSYIDTINFNQFGFTVKLFCAGQEITITANKPKSGAATVVITPQAHPGLNIPNPVIPNPTGNYNTTAVSINYGT
ncbi:hypothetical protein [Sorangium sp. So ce693]|uniref:hypothetical protein n=1 Tax=Sorangium sp. So ce693 TaxID=3133318 RepID=UPI003F60D606